MRFQHFVKRELGVASSSDVHFKLLRRSIDARGKRTKVHLSGELFFGDLPEAKSHKKEYPDVVNATPVIVIGAGPAGLFAGLRLLELGRKPIILERGKDVRARRRDLAAINKDHIVNSESNYCFGEGGAGTYSDGKLYTRSKKRGDVNEILSILVGHGAKEEILIDTHPHIGTNKLPQIVTAIRETIIEAGGDIRFNCKVTDLIINDTSIVGVGTAEGDEIDAEAVILATGHSATDMYQLLHRKNIALEAKPFAIGVRVEHEQQLIDQIQYGQGQRGSLPAASYALAHQMKEQRRSVFSFCLCPGGFIVPAATTPGELVVNGMSPSRRDARFANSGIVVAVDQKDMMEYGDKGVLAGLYYRQSLEQKACKMTGGGQKAPAQRLLDFVNRKSSSHLKETSYQPGLEALSMDEVLPEIIASNLRVAFKSFGKKMKGYLTNEAQIIGIESRTSAPLRIPRDSGTLAHVQIKNLYPCGEGAGYAGGIVSAAIDGMRCAQAAVGSD
ncbi:MAG: NAD(P)/FAD-dependent oxidoreductase [Cyclobacteriaceae bacterium]